MSLPNNRFLTHCSECGGLTSRAYAKKNEGKCKSCVTGASEQQLDPNAHDKNMCNYPTREERILDHGYQAYAREEGHYDNGGDA